MLKVINFKTAFYKEDLFTKFKIKQGDTVKFNVEIEDAPESLSKLKQARFLLRRADKTVLYEEIDIEVNGKVVTFEAPAGSTAINGTSYGELEFSDDKTYTSSTFVFVFDVVSKAGRIEEAVESSDEIFIIKEIRDFINAIKNDLNGIKDDVVDLEARQNELDERMEEVFAKAERLIEEVGKVDVNLEDLISENERAEINIEELGNINDTAQELKDMTLSDITNLRNEAVNSITRLGDESMNNLSELASNSKDELKDLKEEALELIRENRTDAVNKINTVKQEALESVNADINRALRDLEVNIDEALGEIVNGKDNALEEIEEAINRAENAVIGSVEDISNLKEQVLNEIKNDRDEALENIETNTDNALDSINEKYLEAVSRMSELDTVNLENIKQAKENALNTINTLKDEVLSDMESIKNQYVEDMSNIKVDINSTLGQAQNILQALKDENALSMEWIGKVEEAIEKAKQAEIEVDNAINIASDLASRLDLKQAEGNALDVKLTAAVERAKEISNSLSECIGEGNDLKPDLEELLNSLKAVEATLEELCEESDEKVEILGGLFDPADERIRALRELIEEAKRYEVVVRQWIDTKAGDHTEIEERLLILETAVINIQDKLNSLMTNNISGAIENVVITNWDTIENKDIFNALDIPENFKNVFVGKLGSDYDCVVGFFNREVEGKTAVIDYSKADRRLEIINFIAGDVISMSGYKDGQWEELAGTQYINYFGGTYDHIINKVFYHDFKIYDNHGNLLREKYGIENSEFTVNDFNNAIVLNNYRVSQKAGELLGNTPVKNAFNGVLEVEITDSIIKQELTVEDGSVYKRICKLGSWFTWEKVLNNNALIPLMNTNAGTLGEGLQLISGVEYVMNYELENENKNYPEVKHKVIYSNGANANSIIFFFCNLDREGGKYITYQGQASGNYGYNKFVLNGMEVNKDYVLCSGSDTNITVRHSNPVNEFTTSNVEFRLHHLDFNVYDETGNNIEFYAPVKETIKDFNYAVNNGFYPIAMSAGELSSIKNGPDKKEISGDVKGNLEVVNGVQKLTLNSHNKTFVREIGGIWKDINANSISKTAIATIKAGGESTPEFLRTLPVDLRHFNKQDKKTVIFRKDENNYVVIRATNKNFKMYIRTSGNYTYLNTNTNAKYIQIDTYNALTEEWTTTYNNSSSDYSITYNQEFFTLYHTDAEIYNESSYSTIAHDIKQIEFNDEAFINDFSDALEVGFYNIDRVENDEVNNAPEDVLKGILTVKKVENVIYQEVINAETGDAFTRVCNKHIWSEWKKVGADIEGVITEAEIDEKIKNAINNIDIPEVDLGGFYTKEEVDNKISESISNIEIPEVNLDNYATNEQVDTKISEAISNIEIPEVDLEQVENMIDEAIAGIEIPEVDLSDYYTKEEIDELVNSAGSGGGFIDKLGNGLYRPAEPDKFKSCPLPDFEPLHTYKFEFKNSGGYRMYSVMYIKTPLVDNPDKYIFLSGGTKEGTITLSKLKKDDYLFYRAQGDNNEWITENVSPSNLDLLDKSARVYYHDFPLYDDNGINIVIDDCTKTGINNLDSAVNEGDYSINISEADFNNLYNAPKLSQNKAAIGYMNVKKVEANITQTIYLSSHAQVFTRVLGGEWKDITNRAVSKAVIGSVKGRTEAVELPEFLKNIPPMPLYAREATGMIIIQRNATYYDVIRILDNWSGKVYYAGSTTFYVGVPNNKMYRMTYRTDTAAWTEHDNATTSTTLGSITVTKADFKVFCNTMPITISSASTELYQDVTLLSEDDSINSFDKCLEVGTYNVDIKEGDVIESAPEAKELKGILEVKANDTHTLQELILSDNTTYKRVLSNSIWTAWKQEILVESNIENRINTVEYTNADGMLETYKWVNNAGMITMWIDVKMSEEEYNLGANGLIMKTLNLPEQAQVFGNIIMANITSYCREGENTLSRIVQNAEIISNVSVRGRWRHTDNTYPKIDRFTIMITGY